MDGSPAAAEAANKRAKEGDDPSATARLAGASSPSVGPAAVAASSPGLAPATTLTESASSASGGIFGNVLNCSQAMTAARKAKETGMASTMGAGKNKASRTYEQQTGAVSPHRSFVAAPPWLTARHALPPPTPPPPR